MSISFWTALNGLKAASTRVDLTAHNIANVNTDGFKYYRTNSTECIPYGTEVYVERVNTPGVQYINEEGDIVELSNTNVPLEMVNLLTSEAYFKVNLKTIEVQNSMMRNLLDRSV